MNDKKIMDLKNKVVDLKRFAFILLALSGFLSIGLVLPNESVVVNQQGMMIGLIGVLLIMALLFHRSAMKTQKLLDEEE